MASAAQASDWRTADEPGLVPEEADEPAIAYQHTPEPESTHHFRIELGAGLSSLVVDPDVKQGVGGGVYIGYQYGRIGAELSVFLGYNRYAGELGAAGSEFLEAFIAGNVSLSPTVELTDPNDRLRVHLDLGVGAYAIANAIRTVVWTLGLSGGVSATAHLTSWLAVGFKIRYHVFNLARLTGGDLLDRATFQELGAMDRLEIPAFVAVHF